MHLNNIKKFNAWAVCILVLNNSEFGSHLFQRENILYMFQMLAIYGGNIADVFIEIHIFISENYTEIIV